MNAPDRFFLRWLSPVLFGVWSAALLYLLVTQRYTMFLRPAFGLLLIPAHFIALGLMIASLPAERPAVMNIGGALRAAVLLVPLLYLVGLSESSLGSRAFTNRFVGTSGINAGLGAASALPPKPPAPGRSQADEGLTILNLMLNPESYNGRHVAFTGMMVHDEGLKTYFGGRQTAVYRFLITCCVADAIPLAVAVESDQTKGVATDQWVKVKGVFHLRKADGGPVPVVEDAEISLIEAPTAPYLF